MKEKGLTIIIACICSFFLIQTLDMQGKGGPNGSGGKGKGKNKPQWSPNNWQESLPDIIVKEGKKKKKYSFKSLIDADGYLCPGSARCYKTLQTALPLLYKDGIPNKDDFKVSYGKSDCATRTYKYFMGKKYKSDSHLECDDTLRGRQQSILRKSTGVKVLVTYDPPSADKHTPAGAQAGEVILKASDGDGMKVEIINPE